MKLSRQKFNGAFWCDAKKFPQWQKLRCSLFDRSGDFPDKMVEFRTFLTWKKSETIALRFSAGCRFRLFLNGVFLEDGPVEVGGDYGKATAPDWWFFDEISLKKHLLPGKNELRFELIPAGIMQTDYTLGFGWAWCAVFRGERWEAIPAKLWEFRENLHYCRYGKWNFSLPENPWQKVCRPVDFPIVGEKLDLPRLQRKKRQDFAVRFPFGKNANVATRGKKVVVSPGDPVAFYLVFEEEVGGNLEVVWRGDHAMHLALEFEEQYGVTGNFREEIDTSQCSGACRTIPAYAFRFVRVAVTPSDFTTPADAGKVELEFRLHEVAFPLKAATELAARDKLLLAVDAMCLRNLKLCLKRMHLDSPIHQEGLGCIGDYRIEARAEYAAFGESRLACADLRRIGYLLRQEGKLFHTSFELIYILMFKEYVDFTHDTALSGEFYDVLTAIYRRFVAFTGKTGVLTEAENYLFIDWQVDGKANYHHPSSNRGAGALSALWYGALNALAEIAERLQKKDDRAMYLARAKEVRAAFNKVLWDRRKRCYFDGIPGATHRKSSLWLPPDDGKKHVSTLTQIMALACGIPEKTQNPEALLDRVMAGEFPLTPGPYYSFYLFEAIVRYGMWQKYGRKLAKSWRVYLSNGLRECRFAGDYSHGWGVAPSIFLRENKPSQTR